MHGSRVALLKNYRPLLHRSTCASNKSHFEGATIARARACVVASYVVFPAREDPLGQAPGAYSNLYRRELKDYVINALNYGVRYDYFDISIRQPPPPPPPPLPGYKPAIGEDARIEHPRARVPVQPSAHTRPGLTPFSARNLRR